MASLSAGTPTSRTSPRVNLGSFRVAVRGLIGGIVLFLLAELLTSIGLIPNTYLPKATTVVLRIGDLLSDATFLANCIATLSAWAISLLLSFMIAVPLGVLLGSSDRIYRSVIPLIEFARPIPPAALIPLAILILGQGASMKIALVTFSVAWPILYNTLYGVHGVDAVAVDTARAFGLKRLAIMRRVVLPAAFPLIFTGVRISASLGLIVVISAEMLAAAREGIGAYILNISINGGQMDTVLAAAAIAGLIGVVINILFVGVDRRFLSWRHLGAEE